MLGELHGALRVEPLPWKRIAEITSDLPRVEIHSICAMQQGGQGGRLGRLSEYIYIYRSDFYHVILHQKCRKIIKSHLHSDTKHSLSEYRRQNLNV